MLYLNPALSEQHFIESYISGLKELVPFIDLSQPTTLEEVFEQAKLHEQALSIIMRKSKSFYKPLGAQQQGSSTTKATLPEKRDKVNYQQPVQQSQGVN